MTIAEILHALQDAHPDDLQIISRYVAWVAFRRRTHNEFFSTFHWVSPSHSCHWISF
ncbi:MAG TPA: hypothetical protein VI755_11490 [Anaerolineales bacterium]|nr:hypothetical protein [Anaerolineales bacterium]